MSVIEDILDKARWFYIPYQPYKTFYHLIVENDVDDWTLYFLENISSAGQIADVSGLMGGLDFFNEPKGDTQARKPENLKQDFPIPPDYAEVRKYEVFRVMEKERGNPENIDRDIDGCGIVREVHGNLGAMIHEFQKVLK